LSYFAAAVARRGRDWEAEELDLGSVEDLDGIVDVMRVATGDDADTVVLLLEEDDEWFAVVRLDEDSDPRVFVSDRRGDGDEHAGRDPRGGGRGRNGR